MDTQNKAFIKANTRIRIAGSEYAFLNLPLSLFGVSGIRWAHFDPRPYVGKQAEVTLDVRTKTPFRIQATGTITLEETFSQGSKVTTYYLGINFDFTDEVKQKLATAISAEGFLPTSYLRKFPRIPIDPKIPEMPLKAHARAANGNLISFDIGNISPGGILIMSDNPNAEHFHPGMKVRLQVEARRLSLEPFSFEGLICRRITEPDESKGKIRRMLGVRYWTIEPKHKEALLDTLKSILATLYSQKMYKSDE